MLERCWAHKQNDRPSIESVLRYLEVTSDLSPPPWVGDGTHEDEDSPSYYGLSNRTSGTRTNSSTHQVSAI